MYVSVSHMISGQSSHTHIRATNLSEFMLLASKGGRNQVSARKATTGTWKERESGVNMGHTTWQSKRQHNNISGQILHQTTRSEKEECWPRSVWRQKMDLLGPNHWSNRILKWRIWSRRCPTNSSKTTYVWRQSSGTRSEPELAPHKALKMALVFPCFH